MEFTAAEAGEFADTFPPSNNPPPRVSAPVTPAQAAPAAPVQSAPVTQAVSSSGWTAGTLFNGLIPSLSHGDSFANSRASDLCRKDWQQFRRLPVDVKPIKASRVAIEQEAQRVGLPKNKLHRVMETFLKNQNGLPNQRYVTVIDFDKPSNQNRMFVIDVQSGKIKSYKSMHGEGSGGIGSTPTQFSNSDGTFRSSLGCAVATFDHKTTIDANGKVVPMLDRKGRKIPLKDSKGRNKLMLQGFDNTDAKHSNDMMCNRSIFMHPAGYASGGGRSWGCPAVEPGKKQEIYDQIGNGGLICTYRDGESTINDAKFPRKRRNARGSGRRGRRR